MKKDNKLILLFVLLAGIILAVIIGTYHDKPLPYHEVDRADFQFDVLDDSTILISSDGDDWYTISSDSVRYFIIDNIY